MVPPYYRRNHARAIERREKERMGLAPVDDRSGGMARLAESRAWGIRRHIVRDRPNQRQIVRHSLNSPINSSRFCAFIASA
jgi:hypothetical protein